ncbi:unnamed protein product [Camellia sinensis]
MLCTSFLYTISPSKTPQPRTLSLSQSISKPKTFEFNPKKKKKNMNSFNNNIPNFDNLLLQTLMGRLQIHPPNHHSTPPPPSPSFLNQTLEDLLFDTATNLSDADEDDSTKTQLSKEESKLEKELIRTILTGKIETLKPNSGQAVTIGEHHICVGFHQETGSDYRVWEWHGHVMLFDDENGYTPEYIYGNYFERIQARPVVATNDDDDDDDDEKEEKIGNLGLRELIESGDSGGGRILHRSMNMNAGSPSVLVEVWQELAKKPLILEREAAHRLWFNSLLQD